MLPYRLPAEREPELVPQKPKQPWLTAGDISPASVLIGQGIAQVLLSMVVVDSRPGLRLAMGAFLLMLGVVLVVLLRRRRLSRGY